MEIKKFSEGERIGFGAHKACEHGVPLYAEMSITAIPNDLDIPREKLEECAGRRVEIRADVIVDGDGITIYLSGFMRVLRYALSYQIARFTVIGMPASMPLYELLCAGFELS